MGTLTLLVLGWIVVIVQAVLFGLLALWVASRKSRVGYVVGGILIFVLVVWPSLVVGINAVTGYPTNSTLETNVATVLGVAIGWTVGRKRRLRNAGTPTH